MATLIDSRDRGTLKGMQAIETVTGLPELLDPIVNWVEGTWPITNEVWKTIKINTMFYDPSSKQLFWKRSQTEFLELETFPV